MDDIWDPDRLENIGYIMSRYSEHIAPGHVVRLGIEGDPCARYRSSDDDAVVATVQDVTREEDGTVRFRAQRHDGSIVHLDNRSVAPESVWEIDPSHLASFRASIGRDDGDARPAPPDVDYEALYRSTQHRMEVLVEDLERVKSEEAVFRQTIASTVRELAGDVLRASKGEDTQFAHRYVDKYDLAMLQGEFRSSDALKSSTSEATRDARHEFEYKSSATIGSLKESSEVTV